MLSMKRYIVVLVGCLAWSAATAQFITEQAAVERALKSYPSVQLAEQETRQRKALERTAFNPQQTQVVFESPADVGVGVEVQQQFDFPGVYVRRSKWLKSQTALAGEAASLTRRELTQAVRLAYLDAQAAQAQVLFYARQDSLWQGIAAASRRLFEGGQINRADLLFAETKAGQVANLLFQSRTYEMNAFSELAAYLNDNVTQVSPLLALSPSASDTSGVFYFEKYRAQQQQVAAAEIAVRRAERLPGLMVGYLRVPEPDTDYRSRLRAGITLPLFQGQYKGEMDAARIALESAQTQMALQRQEARATRFQLLQTMAQTTSSLGWLEGTALPLADELVASSRRLYEGGEYDYIQFLRNVSDAFDLQTTYLETLKMHNSAVVGLAFLIGN